MEPNHRSLSILIVCVLSLLAPVRGNATEGEVAGTGPAVSEMLTHSVVATSPSWQLRDVEIDAMLAQSEETDWSAPEGLGSTAPRRWWTLAASAVLPGLGETLTGYRRGWFMMAADAGVWYGIMDRQSEGDDWELKYEEFALEHWDEEQWARALNEGRLTPFYPELGAGTARDEVALYVSRDLDEREWFENLGKWDVFAWGWREFWDDVYNGNNHAGFLGEPGAGELYNPLPDDPSTWFFPNDKATMTPLRDQYLDMRVKSNDAYQTRDQLFNVAVLLRVFSVLQMAYLEGFIGGRYDAADQRRAVDDTPRADWVLAPMGRDGALVGWKVVY